MITDPKNDQFTTKRNSLTLKNKSSFKKAFGLTRKAKNISLKPKIVSRVTRKSFS